jgi:hypothetical protein
MSSTKDSTRSDVADQASSAKGEMFLNFGDAACRVWTRVGE